jgi:rubrerythrin
MTVQQDIQKAVASAQSALGTYAVFAESTLDQSAKQMFKDMAHDMQRHMDVLNSRLHYVTQNNDMNQPLS